MSDQSSSFGAFISHAKADQKKAQDVAKSLEERNIKCWIAPRDVRPSRAYGDEIIRGIEQSRCLILVLSSAANESAFVAREIERAVSKNRPIFTIRIEEVVPSPSLELFISGTQWIDAFAGRLGIHVERMAGLLTEEEGSEPPARIVEVAAKPRRPSKWAWRAGAALAVLIAAIAIGFVWQSQQPSTTPPIASNPQLDPAVNTGPVTIKPGGEEVAETPQIQIPGFGQDSSVAAAAATPEGPVAADQMGVEPPVELAEHPDDPTSIELGAATAAQPAEAASPPTGPDSYADQASPSTETEPTEPASPPSDQLPPNSEPGPAAPGGE